jgi:hypothetical protein
LTPSILVALLAITWPQEVSVCLEVSSNYDGVPLRWRYLAKDFTAMSALYTHHQYIAGFFLLGAFAHGAIYLIRDANLTILYRGFRDSCV